MNSKILFIVVAAAVIVVAAAAFLALGGGSGSDYTLLDSDENIQKGMTIETTWGMGGGKADAEYAVQSVTDGAVVFSIDSVMKDVLLRPDHKDFDSYAPGIESKFGFDYTDEEDFPDGVSVKVSGNDYRIVGKYETEYYGLYPITVTCDMAVTYDGEDVTAVNGTMRYDMVEEDGTSSESFTLETIDGKIEGTYGMMQEGTLHCDV